MPFEYDGNKSESNKSKHGIDFEEAQALWDDPNLLEVQVVTTDEPRFLIVGAIRNKIWSAIVTYRGDNTRIISVRRARKEEAEQYEKD